MPADNDDNMDSGKKQPKQFGGLLTLPNFYHKDLNQLLTDYDKKMTNQEKNRNDHIEENIVDKMREKSEQGELVKKHHEKIIK